MTQEYRFGAGQGAAPCGEGEELGILGWDWGCREDPRETDQRPPCSLKVDFVGVG